MLIKPVHSLLLCLCLTACANTPEAPTTATQQLATTLAREGVSAIVGACVTHNAIGEVTLDLEQSEAALRALQARLGAIAEQNAVTLKSVLAPLVCADLGADQRYRMAIQRGIPTFGGEMLLINRQRMDAASLDELELVRHFQEQSWMAVAVNRGRVDAGSPRPISISPAYTRQLRQWLQSEKVLLVQGLAASYSGGERAVNALFSGFKSAGIPRDDEGQVQFPKDGMAYQVALVDLQRNQVLWAKTSAFTAADVHSPEPYRSAWSQELLLPLFSADRSARTNDATAPF